MDAVGRRVGFQILFAVFSGLHFVARVTSTLQVRAYESPSSTGCLRLLVQHASVCCSLRRLRLTNRFQGWLLTQANARAPELLVLFFSSPISDGLTTLRRSKQFGRWSAEPRGAIVRSPASSYFRRSNVLRIPVRWCIFGTVAHLSPELPKSNHAVGRVKVS
jgi:hypothetical protein